MGKEHFYIIQEVIDETEDVRTYRMSFGERTFSFAPGQFLLVKHLPNGTKAPLTLSSSPLDQDGFELTLKYTGEFGKQFYENARVGDPIAVVGPSGRFCLPIEGREPICFIGRDYTISAARSYLRWVKDLKEQGQKGLHRRFFLFQEISSVDQVVYGEELEETVTGFERFLLLDGNAPPSWCKRKGQIDATFLTSELSDIKRTIFFVCGEGVEIKRWKRELATLPIPEENVHLDRWS